MSTRALIFAQGEGGKIEARYNHWDGYISGLGATLWEHYNTPEKVKALFALGHNFSSVRDTPADCVLSDKAPESIGLVKALRWAMQSDIEFSYFWDGARWYAAPTGFREGDAQRTDGRLARRGIGFTQFIPLSLALDEYDEAVQETGDKEIAYEASVYGWRRDYYFPIAYSSVPSWTNEPDSFDFVVHIDTAKLKAALDNLNSQAKEWARSENLGLLRGADLEGAAIRFSNTGEITIERIYQTTRDEHGITHLKSFSATLSAQFQKANWGEERAITYKDTNANYCKRLEESLEGMGSRLAKERPYIAYISLTNGGQEIRDNFGNTGYSY